MTKEKIHTTNYFDTFIEVAEDTKVTCGARPPSKGDKQTIAEMQYELLVNHPYQFTSDDILFQVFADSNGKIAIFGMETEQYKQLQKDPKLKKVKAMRTSKK